MFEQYYKILCLSYVNETLLKCGITSLPVDLTYIDIEIIRYSKCGLTQIFNPEAFSGDGFITKVNGVKTIYVNDKIKMYGRRRFTVGHELGHGILGHPLNKIITRNSKSTA